jgi:hypothetical protein
VPPARSAKICPAPFGFWVKDKFPGALKAHDPEAQGNALGFRLLKIPGLKARHVFSHIFL